MPMFGVIKLTLERDGGSISGEDDFFSVARTMPFVAVDIVRNQRSFSSNCVPIYP